MDTTPMLDFGPQTSHCMIADGRKAHEAICKNSRLRSHYLTLVVLNNTMRAFVVNYDLDPRFTASQMAWHSTLVRVESRKDRTYLTSDKIAILEGLNTFQELLEVTTDEQLQEMLLYVDRHRSECKWVTTERKSLKSSRRKNKG